MDLFFTALITGVVSGALFALLSFGIILTYRTTGIFNFAQGAIGMFFVFLYFQLIQGGEVFFLIVKFDVQLTVPTWIALPIVVLVVAPGVGFLLDKVLFSKLRTAETHVQIVSTIGLLVALQGLVALIWTANSGLKTSEPFLGDSILVIGTFSAPWSRFVTIGLTVAISVGLVSFLRYSMTGVRMRAVVDRTDLAELVGVNSARISGLSWALSSGFAALAAILIAPVQSATLDLRALPFLVVPAVAAAVIGKLESIPLTLIGGIAIGVGQALSQAYLGSSTVGPVLSASLPFLVLFGALLAPVDWKEVRPEVVLRQSATPKEGRVSRSRVAAGVGAVIFLAILPAGSAFDVPPFNIAPLDYFAQFPLAFARVPGVALIFLGLVLLVGYAGQISLAHGALAGVGAFVAAHATSAGVPFLLAALLGGLAAVIPGAILAYRAVRLSPLFLGLATLAFAALFEEVLTNFREITNRGTGVFFERPGFLDSPYAFYVAGLILFLIASLVLRNVRLGSIGLSLNAMRDSETALAGFGASLVNMKLVVFSVSSFLAGFGGAMLVGASEVASPLSFTIEASLLALALVVVGGVRYARGALIGAILFQLLGPLLQSLSDGVAGDGTGFQLYNIGSLSTLMFGFAALVLASNPGGIVEQSRDGWNDFRERFRGRSIGDAIAVQDLEADPAPGVVDDAEPELISRTQALGRARSRGAMVTFENSDLFHSPDCLLVVGKTPIIVTKKRQKKLSPCTVCQDVARRDSYPQSSSPVPEPAFASLPEPVIPDPVPEPVLEPAPIIVAEPLPAPSFEPPPEPLAEPLPKPRSEPSFVSLPEPLGELTPKSSLEPLPEPITEPLPEPARGPRRRLRRAASQDTSAQRPDLLSLVVTTDEKPVLRPAAMASSPAVAQPSAIASPPIAVDETVPADRTLEADLSVSSDDVLDLSDLTKQELRVIADQLDIEGRAEMLKGELLEAIERHADDLVDVYAEQLGY